MDTQTNASSSDARQTGPGTTSPARGAVRPSRDDLARTSLQPLGASERPLPLLVAVAVGGALAVAIMIGALTIHDLGRHGGSLPGGVFLAGVLALLAVGMYRRRYWAVLGFEALLAFQILVTSLALVIASTVLAAVLCLVSILLSGWLFWKLVRVMGRIQVTERASRVTEDTPGQGS